MKLSENVEEGRKRKSTELLEVGQKRFNIDETMNNLKKLNNNTKNKDSKNEAESISTIVDRVEKKKQVKRKYTEVGLSLAVRGHISKVHLLDFMVHRDFEWWPGHSVNFITGKNGSGKSSLLQGLVLGLMSGARQVGRYARLGDFVRKGAGKAVVSVSLHNTGELPYQPDRFGDMVVFKRTIHVGGKSGLQLLNSSGRQVNDGRAAVDEAKAILAHMDIELENPLAILQQEHAKELLQVEKPEKLYMFFESATMLTQCREEYKRSASELQQVGCHLLLLTSAISC